MKPASTGGQPEYHPPLETAGLLTTQCVAYVISIISCAPTAAVDWLLQPRLPTHPATLTEQGDLSPHHHQSDWVNREVGL